MHADRLSLPTRRRPRSRIRFGAGAGRAQRPAAGGRDPATPDGVDQLELAAGALVLGRYRLERRLGRGGFGEVWRARDERLGRRVALKAMPGGGGRGAREAAAAARLSHPAIVALFEAVDAGQSAFLVSELIEGLTLAELERTGALSDRDAARIGLALCGALHHAHTHGVIHRDVKPQNVLVPGGSEPAAPAKLTDFGVAHLVGDDPLTRTGDVLGTLAYMAPEQASGRRVDARADLYSLGLVLHEALAGAHPAQHASPAAALRRLGAPLASLRRSRRDLPRDLVAAIDRATAPEPSARGSLDALARVLAECMDELSDAAGAVGPGPWERIPAARWPGWLPRMWTPLTGAGLAAAWLSWVTPGPPLPFAPVLAVVGLAGALALAPRLSWAVAVLAAGAWTAAGPPHAAGWVLVAALAQLAAIGVLPGRPGAWALPAAAAGLGALGLAGAAPALAAWAAGGWEGTWHARARAGAAAWTGLALGELLAGQRLGSGPPAGVWAPDRWAGSLSDAVSHALVPLAASGLLAIGGVWVLAAIALPWLLRARSLPWLLAGGGAWTVGLACASAGLGRALGQADPRGVAAGAAAACLLAVAGRLMRGDAPRADRPLGPAGPLALGAVE